MGMFSDFVATNTDSNTSNSCEAITADKLLNETKTSQIDPIQGVKRDDKPKLSQEQVNALTNVLTDPTNAVALKLSQNIGEKLNTGETKERLEKTSDKVINATLNTFENEAENKENKSLAISDDIYFQTHTEALKTGGITTKADRALMERVVKWSAKWDKLFFVLFGWWLIGIRTLFKNFKPFHWTLTLLASVLFVATLTMVVFGIVSLFGAIF